MKLADTFNAYGFGRARRTGLRLEAQGRRNAGILAIRARMPDADLVQCAMLYDFEIAPLTTNAAQLTETGVSCWHAQPLDLVESSINGLTGRQMRLRLIEIIEGLADLGVFLVETDHLTDHELLMVLVTKIIRESIHDLPPSPGVCEFISLAMHKGERRESGVSFAKRDEFLPRRSQP